MAPVASDGDQLVHLYGQIHQGLNDPGVVPRTDWAQCVFNENKENFDNFNKVYGVRGSRERPPYEVMLGHSLRGNFELWRDIEGAWNQDDALRAQVYDVCKYRDPFDFILFL